MKSNVIDAFDRFADRRIQAELERHFRMERERAEIDAYVSVLTAMSFVPVVPVPPVFAAFNALLNSEGDAS